MSTKLINYAEICQDSAVFEAAIANFNIVELIRLRMYIVQQINLCDLAISEAIGQLQETGTKIADGEFRQLKTDRQQYLCLRKLCNSQIDLLDQEKLSGTEFGLFVKAAKTILDSTTFWRIQSVAYRESQKKRAKTRL